MHPRRPASLPVQVWIVVALLATADVALAQTALGEERVGPDVGSVPGDSDSAQGDPVAEGATPGPSEQELEAARGLFTEGLDLLEEERWAEAAERFQQVLNVKFSPVVAYNLAFSLSRMGRLIEAVDLLRPIARDMSGDRDARLAASALLDEIDPKIASITVHLSGPREGTSIYLDGRELPPAHLGRPQRVDPGEVAVRVERDGEVVASRSVMVGGEHGTRVGVTLEIPPPKVPEPRAVALAEVVRQRPAPVESPRDESEPGITGQWWFWALSGGVAIAAAATVVALASDSGDEPAPVMGDIGPGVIRGPVAEP